MSRPRLMIGMVGVCRVSRRRMLGACAGGVISRVAARGEVTDAIAGQVIEAVQEARIVMLGEPSHGAGSAFTAKVRLVQLLHERLGFDVLVWESGLIDLERTEAGLRGGLAPVEAAQRGIFKIWSASAECQPLFAYAKASHGGARPLTMAGFDMQVTAPGTLDYFAGELRAFVGTLDAAKRERAQELADQVVHHFGLLFRYTEALAAGHAPGDSPRPVAEDLVGLEGAAAALTALIRDGGERAGFMERALASLAGYGATLLETDVKHSEEEAARDALTRENRRDRINAENLKWLIDTAYAGRKVIVWAHNAHVMNAWYGKGFDSVSLEALSAGMKTTGVWLSEWYGEALYKIGFTAYQGRDGLVGARPEEIPPAPPGSLEERLHRLGEPEVLLPLRGLTAPVSIRIPKYKTELVGRPAQLFDAVYFIDTMRPATLIGKSEWTHLR